jgi:hypothetical protein
MRFVLPAFFACLLAGCGDASSEGTSPDGSMTLPPASNPTQPGNPTTPSPSTNNEPAKPPLEMLSEVVYVFQKDYDGNDYMCTGVLVAKDIVLTAGHCLDDNMFESFEVLTSKKDKRISVKDARWLGTGGDPSDPDVGLLRLEAAIELPAYAEITDITERVEKGEKLTGVAIVRTAEEMEAPLKAVENLQIGSATKFGYEQGISTPLFSNGGDSGAGLFLVENGRTTHKLVGIERNPDQDRKLDHFTRLGPQFKQWFDENVKGD